MDFEGLFIRGMYKELSKRPTIFSNDSTGVVTLSAVVLQREACLPPTQQLTDMLGTAPPPRVAMRPPSLGPNGSGGSTSSGGRRLRRLALALQSAEASPPAGDLPAVVYPGYTVAVLNNTSCFNTIGGPQQLCWDGALLLEDVAVQYSFTGAAVPSPRKGGTLRVPLCKAAPRRACRSGLLLAPAPAAWPEVRPRGAVASRSGPLAAALAGVPSLTSSALVAVAANATDAKLAGPSGPGAGRLPATLAAGNPVGHCPDACPAAPALAHALQQPRETSWAAWVLERASLWLAGR